MLQARAEGGGQARVQRQDTCVLGHVGHVTGKVENKIPKKIEEKRVQLIRAIIYLGMYI